MTYEWNENVTLKFLEEYKKYECLWNPNSIQYFNCCSKEDVIRKIIDKLNIPFLTPAECQCQIETITRKYEEEQTKILHGLHSGKPYKSNLSWYPLMQEMLTKSLSNGIDETLRITVCTNLIPDKKKKTQISKKTKTNHLCGNKIINKLFKEKSSPNKEGNTKMMSYNSIKYGPCPGIGNNHLCARLDDRTDSEDSRSRTGLNNYPGESICIREIKKRRDIPRNNLSKKSTECSPRCRGHSENFHYAARDNYNISNKTPYFSKGKNSDLNYNEFRNQYQRRFLPCPNSVKPPDQLFSSNQRNSYKNSNNVETYCPKITTCGNNFHKTTELYNRQFQEFPQSNAILNKQSCLRNGDQIFPTTDNQGIVQFTPKFATKCENGTCEAVSQLNINIQCGEKSLDNRNIHTKTNRETQTFLERKQQSVSTNLVNFETKETQDEVGRQTKQTGTDFEDFNQNVENTVCVSRSQSDYILLMPGGKSLRLSKKSSREKFMECPGANENRFVDDEVFSVCTEASCQDSKLVDSDTMTTPQLIQCVEEMLNIRNNYQDEVQSVNLSKTGNREVEECKACKNFEIDDEDLRFCFKKLFNKDLSTSDCFPCLKEKIHQESTGELTKTLLTILKYALDLDNKAENNLKGWWVKSKHKPEMIKRICKCIKKLSEIEAEKGLFSKNTLIEESRKYSKQVETENAALISRSTNTFAENTPVEISHITLKNVETNTDFADRQKDVGTSPINTNFPDRQKDIGTSPIENIRSTDAMTQVIAHFSPKIINKGKSIGTQKRDPIFVRVVSANDRPKMTTTQSKSSQSSQSGVEDSKKNNCKRVLFNEKKKFECPKKYFRCIKDCKELNCSKIRIAGRNNSRVKKKLLDNKLTDVPKSKSLENKKIFFSDFCLESENLPIT
ncbi:uncharacterized protein LOC117166844 isoform X2 [Belonocnema kinseyi]|uniref:uncharacterized protein LOC117166844 isoform X2 n=1 Tax=Belonocnema kinseyi TaxID=2817044 RepID=UPI00143D218B|nr:uncharacterized protein LOC117166844 isoform X2 [Belonocnema kinseyi]